MKIIRLLTTILFAAPLMGQLPQNVTQSPVDGTLTRGFVIGAGTTVSNNGTINGTGTIDFSQMMIVYPSVNAHYVLAGPSTGTTGTAAYRFLVNADLPSDVPVSVADDTNVTGAIASQVLTLGWQGTLAPVRGGLGTSSVPTSAQIPIANGGNYGPQTASGDWTINASGVDTVAKVNGVAYGTGPSTNTVPVVTGTNQTTYEAVPNDALANSAVGIAGNTVALGSSVTQDQITGLSTAGIVYRIGANSLGTVAYSGGSLVFSGGNLTLSGDSASPGNNVFYGTNSSGTKGWYADTGSFVTSVAGTLNQITASASTGSVTLSLAGPHNYTTQTAHGVILGEGTSPLAASSVGTSGQAFVSGGSSADGTYGALNLAGGSGVFTGTLPVGNGGTGAATLSAHGPLLGEGASPIAAAAAGTSGQPFLSGGSSADGAYGSISLAGGSSVVTGVLPPANGGTGINNGSSTLTVGGNFAMSGAFTFAGTLTSNTAVTFPASGTLLAANTAASLNSLSITGTGGAGFVDMAPQGAAPANPASGHMRSYSDASGRMNWLQPDGFGVTWDPTGITSSRTYTLPDASGTVLTTAAINTTDLATGATVVGVQAANSSVNAYGYWGMSKMWNKLSTMSGANATTAQLRYLICGDSMATLAMKYVFPRLLAAYSSTGQANGYFDLAGLNYVCYPEFYGSALQQPSYDYTKSITGTYVELQASGDGIGFFMGTQSPSVYPYSPPISSNSAIPVTHVQVQYATLSGGGTFTMQTSPDGSTWTNVTGLTSINTNSAVAANVIAQATITSTSVYEIRAIWVSGGPVYIDGAGADNPTISGVLIMNLSRGAMVMDQFSTNAATQTVINQMNPDFVSLCSANDGVSGINQSLTDFEALWTTIQPSILYIGRVEGAADTAGVSCVQFNSIVQQHAASNALGYPFMYVNSYEYQHGYAFANALGWMADVTHPDDKFNSLMGNVIMQLIGMNNPVYNQNSQAANPVSVSTNYTTYVSQATTPTSPTGNNGVIYYDSTGYPSFIGPNSGILKLECNETFGTFPLTINAQSGGATMAYLSQSYSDTTHLGISLFNSNIADVLSSRLGNSTSDSVGLTHFGSTSGGFGSISADSGGVYFGQSNGGWLWANGSSAVIKAFVETSGGPSEVAEFDPTYFEITQTTASTGSGTGAFQDAGGAYIAGASYLGSTLNVASALTAANGLAVTTGSVNLIGMQVTTSGNELLLAGGSYISDNGAGAQTIHMAGSNAGLSVLGTSTTFNNPLFSVGNGSGTAMFINGDGRVIFGNGGSANAVVAINLSGLRTSGDLLDMTDSNGTVKFTGSNQLATTYTTLNIGANNFGNAIEINSPTANNVLNITGTAVSFISTIQTGAPSGGTAEPSLFGGYSPSTGWNVSSNGTVIYGLFGTVYKHGQASLSGGTAIISDTSVTSNTRVWVGYHTPGGTPGAVYVSALTTGTGFTLTSTSALDTSIVEYFEYVP